MYERVLVVVGLISTLAMPGVASAQANLDPWFGTWVSGNNTLTMEPWEDGVKLLEWHPQPDGTVRRVIGFGRMDGKVYYETIGGTRTSGMMFERVDAQTYRYTGLEDGKVMSKVDVTFSRDGVTRTSHLTMSNGALADRTTVWKRKQTLGTPDEPWYGTWKLNDRSTLIMEPWEDGFLLTYRTLPAEPGGQVRRGAAFGRFDGHRYRETGSDAVDYLIFKKVDARTIAVVHYKGDKETVTATLSFPPDGKTRISKTTGTDVSGKPVNTTTTWTRVE